MTWVITAANISSTSSGPGSSPAWELPANLFDGNTASKWLVHTSAGDSPAHHGYVQVTLTHQRKITSYQWVTADDNPHRDPKTWTLEGSNNNTDWTVLDTVTDYTAPDTRLSTTSTFTVDSPGFYLYYRWFITASKGPGTGEIQVSELYLTAVSQGILLESPLPFTENFSSGNWNRWALGAYGVANNSVANAFSVESGSGKIKTSNDNPSFFGAGRAIPNGLPVTTTDQGVLLTFTITGNNQDRLHITLRGDGAWNTDQNSADFPRPVNGYRVHYTIGSGGTSFFKTVAGVETTIGVASNPSPSHPNPVSGTAYKIRCEINGTTFRNRIWLATDSEPSTWRVFNTDSSHSAGKHQLAFNAGGIGNVLLDDIYYYAIPDVSTPMNLLLEDGTSLLME